ncbi:30S ribosomal protein S16 [Candidatus Kaiserbacteria bacterium]|nr:30S ribosomal protein S16 [Candidatus Kaiserbacteria bacterium]
MLKIRLQRTGRANDPSYRVIVVEHTESPKTGNVVEQVGTYNPKTKAKNLLADRIKYWLSVGAKASGTVHNMLVSAAIIEGKKVNVLPKKSPPKAEQSEQKIEKSEQTSSAPEASKAQPNAEAETVAAEAKSE